MKEQRAPEGLAELKAEEKYSKPFGKNVKKKPAPAAPVGKMPKWKAQSMAFRQAMGAGSEPASKSNNFNPTQNESTENYDDRTECSFCNRKFNEEAAKRHIPHCEQKFKMN